MKVLLAVLTFAFVVFEDGLAAPGSRSLPKNFIKCKRNDPKLADCLRTAVEDSFQKMKDSGIPSLGVLPLDPLEVQDMKINSGTPNSPVNLRIDFKNMKVHGLPNTTFLDYMIDLENTIIRTVSLSPLASFDADFIADGKILVLPVKGQGTCNFTVYEMKTESNLIFKEEERNGETYWNIDTFDVKFFPKKMTMYFTGLLSQDKTLSDGINTFINENWEVMYEALRSQFEEGFGEIFKEITKRVFGKVPVDKIFVK